MGTGGHYITMLPADWSISKLHDPLPSGAIVKDAMESIYTKEGVESLHILPCTSINVHVVNGQWLECSVVNGQSTENQCGMGGRTGLADPATARPSLARQPHSGPQHRSLSVSARGGRVWRLRTTLRDLYGNLNRTNEIAEHIIRADFIT